jgi:DNA-binding CsgD family transcriptional regulator
MDLTKQIWLSKRERQVLKMYLEEKKGHEIGKELGLNEKTVATYKKRLLIKTNCKTIIGLYRFNLVHNIVEPEYDFIPIRQIRTPNTK